MKPIEFTLCLLLFIFGHSGTVYSQGSGHGSVGAISGKVLDATYNEPLEYANIVVFGARDNSQLTGTITNADGEFRIERLRPGTYDLEIKFLGYESKHIREIQIRPGQPEVDVGTVSLQSTILSMEGVVVEREKAPITYQIDKKVINVSQQQTVLSGTAVDVLENVPSVSVDIEGNVSLRGSGNFTVLVDGRPSVLEPSEALQQIPASSIENIEIITNPSAKYDPEGSAGIINIIMKKVKRHGRNAIINMDAGWDDKYGGDLLVEQKSERIHATVGVDFSKRSFTGDDLEENQTIRDGVTSFVFSEGGSLRGRTSLGLRGQLQFTFNPQNILTLAGRYGDRSHERDSDFGYDEWTSLQPLHELYTSVTDRERSGNFYAFNLNYEHLFDRDGHKLMAELHFDHGDSNEETLHQLVTSAGEIESGQRSTESGPGNEFRAKLDYVFPVTDKRKFEAGYQSELDRTKDITGLFEYIPELEEFALQSQFSNTTKYNKDVHAIYAIYSDNWQKFGVQLGLRGEYTNRTVNFGNQTFLIDRWDYFPTFHTSYKISEAQQFMASYTRRIDRPRSWYLEPFLTWMDAFNVRIGNPSLKPEYIDSYEAGYQTHVGKSLFSTEVYYRVSHNRIERVRSVFEENVTLHSTENVGTDYSLGGEMFFDLGIARNWNVNLMGNIYHYRIEGILNDEPFSRNSFNWSTRLNNVFKFGKSTQLQINGIYHSPSVSSQGKRQGFFVTDVAFRQDFFHKTLSATLQIRDILSTRKFEYTSEGNDFFTYRYSTRESPVMMLNLRYNLNPPKQDRRRENNRPQGDDSSVEEF